MLTYTQLKVIYSVFRLSCKIQLIPFDFSFDTLTMEFKIGRTTSKYRMIWLYFLGAMSFLYLPFNIFRLYESYRLNPHFDNVGELAFSFYFATVRALHLWLTCVFLWHQDGIATLLSFQNRINIDTGKPFDFRYLNNGIAYLFLMYGIGMRVLGKGWLEPNKLKETFLKVFTVSMYAAAIFVVGISLLKRRSSWYMFSLFPDSQLAFGILLIPESILTLQALSYFMCSLFIQLYYFTSTNALLRFIE